MRKTHTLVQGSESWHQFRAIHGGASEASAMLGISPYMSRTDLLKLKKTGIAPEVSPALQKVFDRGHAVEAPARAIAEGIIGEDLFPATYSHGYLSCSCDGITMMEDVCFEHKQWGDALAESILDGVLPDHHMPQAQQNLMVTGAEKLLFMTSDGTTGRCAWMWVYPDEDYFLKLTNGWTQFQTDLESYEYVEEAQAPVGKAPETLPALRIEVTGMVTASNLDTFKDHAVAVIDKISTDLETDEDFADAEKTVKWCKDVEDRLASAKDHALSQTETIDALFRAIDEISEIARQKRLTLDKLVKTRKESIRVELVQKAQQELAQYVMNISTRWSGATSLTVTAPFADAIKGKRTIASIKDALGTELANAKILANEKAMVIDANLALVADIKHLFPDLSTICHRDLEGFTAIMKVRVAEDEKRKEDEIAKQKQAIADEIEAQRKAREQADEAEAPRKEREQAAALAVVTEVAAETPPLQLEPQPEISEIKQAAVLDHQKHIAGFLKANDFKDHSRIRGILIEYEKFKAGAANKEAA